MKKSVKLDMDSFQGQLDLDAIGEEFILMNDIRKVPFFDYPTKLEYAITIICLKGCLELGVNLKPCMLSENDIFILVPGQIIQYYYRSEDFSGLQIVMSKRFTDNLELNLKDSISVMLHLKENPVLHLAPDEVENLTDYYNILLKTVRQTNNPNRLEMLRLLVQAFFYGVDNIRKIRQELQYKKTTREELFESFYNLVLLHYKDSREVGFYADKLCITPKYLSTVIKETTGKSAFEWINEYVILEAKSLLKSANMTILQVSDALNFANQAFFGRYFKHHVGMSPKEYRGS